MHKKLPALFLLSILLSIKYLNAFDPDELTFTGNYTDDPKLERTMLMLKPDALQRGLMGKIIERFENKGLKLVALKLMWANQSLIEKHYEHHLGKPFFPLLAEYMTSGPVMPMIWEGVNAVAVGRQMIEGAKGEKRRPPGTIRGDYTIQRHRSIVHGSDSLEAADNEIRMWFGTNPRDFLVKWTPANVYYVYSAANRD